MLEKVNEGIKLVPSSDRTDSNDHLSQEELSKLKGDALPSGSHTWSDIFDSAGPRRIIFDEVDGVPRCGSCAAEIFEGLCSNPSCGIEYDSPYDFNRSERWSSEELDGSMMRRLLTTNQPLEQRLAEFEHRHGRSEPLQIHGPAYNRALFHDEDQNDDDEDEEEDEVDVDVDDEDDEDSEMADFIVRDDDDSELADDSADDDESDDCVPGRRRGQHSAEDLIEIEITDCSDAGTRADDASEDQAEDQVSREPSVEYRDASRQARRSRADIDHGDQDDDTAAGSTDVDPADSVQRETDESELDRERSGDSTRVRRRLVIHDDEDADEDDDDAW
jgi:hypothetical protein